MESTTYSARAFMGLRTLRRMEASVEIAATNRIPFVLGILLFTVTAVKDTSVEGDRLGRKLAKALTKHTWLGQDI